MAKFKDGKAREWSIRIDVETAKRIRDLAGVDFLNIDGVLGRLIEDPILICDVIYAAIKPDAEKKKVTSDDLASSFSGDVIEKASDALMEALCDFFPSRRRDLLRKALAKSREIQAAIYAEAEKSLTSGATSTNAQARSGSTQGR